MEQSQRYLYTSENILMLIEFQNSNIVVTISTAFTLPKDPSWSRAYCTKEVFSNILGNKIRENSQQLHSKIFSRVTLRQKQVIFQRSCLTGIIKNNLQEFKKLRQFFSINVAQCQKPKPQWSFQARENIYPLKPQNEKYLGKTKKFGGLNRAGRKKSSVSLYFRKH